MKRSLHVVLLFVTLTGCSQFIFLPDKQQYLTPNLLHLQSDDIYFNSNGIRLHGWWLHATQPSKGTILFLHGNAENISTHIGSVYWLPSHGYDVFLFDYRGYGLSEGKPDLDGIHQDFAAAMEYIFTRPAINKDSIFVFGQSLGGAVALVGSAISLYKNRVRAGIVEGAFSSYRTVAREKLNNSWLTWLFQWPLSFTINDNYRPIDAIPQLSPTPVLIIHSENDEVIPFHHARDLYNAANEPKSLWIISNVYHIQTFTKPQYQQQLLQYLESFIIHS